MEIEKRGTLRILRTTAFGGKLRPFFVYLDEERVAIIEDGTQVDLDVAPGSHTVRLGYDRFNSQSLKVNMREGETIDLNCGTVKLTPRHYSHCVLLLLSMAALIYTFGHPSLPLGLLTAGVFILYIKEGVWSANIVNSPGGILFLSPSLSNSAQCEIVAYEPKHLSAAQSARLLSFGILLAALGVAFLYYALGLHHR